MAAEIAGRISSRRRLSAGRRSRWRRAHAASLPAEAEAARREAPKRRAARSALGLSPGGSLNVDGAGSAGTKASLRPHAETSSIASSRCSISAWCRSRIRTAPDADGSHAPAVRVGAQRRRPAVPALQAASRARVALTQKSRWLTPRACAVCRTGRRAPVLDRRLRHQGHEGRRGRAVINPLRVQLPRCPSGSCRP